MVTSRHIMTGTRSTLTLDNLPQAVLDTLAEWVHRDAAPSLLLMPLAAPSLMFQMLPTQSTCDLTM
ncbi:hypothetical protein AMAG_05712 [Allomyces macrogynus ATCC 38327]|uniref:Uncharacterized protein n=1 Tax=Allomyces macrogynus (strain ATCC 38327) TaxID=578462 RepID=A0A0L0SCV3_ALLM3|nr:hypothetical protein AMAG_05712 [Allomyces macrogynus ATCC 38327]|eukprot:KNE60311.1 hypothetical protein AMAG_05712 [Allomyces macrogynus ATCC 38327]